ncbi:MAG: OadG family protein [Ruminococcus sp.]|nr:OadG family protein [Ruminococcus sp.]
MYYNTAQLLASKLSGKDYTATDIASVVITGMSVVFIGLVLLVLFVSIYGGLFNKANQKKKEKQEAEKQAAEAEKAKKTENKPVQPAVNAPAATDGIEEEIVAVIAAAVAAIGEKSGKKLVVKSIKRSVSQRDPWAAAGLVDNTRPF